MAETSLPQDSILQHRTTMCLVGEGSGGEGGVLCRRAPVASSAHLAAPRQLPVGVAGLRPAAIDAPGQGWTTQACFA